MLADALNWKKKTKNSLEWLWEENNEKQTVKSMEGGGYITGVAKSKHLPYLKLTSEMHS